MEGKSNAPLKVSADSGGESCVICMSAIEHAKRAQINSCSHVFCYECIHAWSKEKSICPLCKRIFSEMSFVRAAVLVTEKVECVYKPPTTHDGPALDCLDSAYFLAEIARLLGHAEQTQRAWFKERRQNPTMYRHKHSNTRQEKHWDLLEESINRLHYLRVQLTPADNELQQILAATAISVASPSVSPAPTKVPQRRATLSFEPFIMLQELYQLQDTLQEIYSARCFNNNTVASPSSASSRQHEEEEEEYYEEEDDYYDYDYDEEEDERMYSAAATASTKRLALSDFVRSPTKSNNTQKTPVTSPSSTKSLTKSSPANPSPKTVTTAPSPASGGGKSKRP